MSHRCHADTATPTLGLISAISLILIPRMKTRLEVDAMLRKLWDLPHINLLGKDRADSKLMQLIVVLSKLLGNGRSHTHD